jgi:protein-S-isoprenylcysteine O-methyltransferase Ste14
MGTRLFALLRAIVVSIAFIWIWTWFFPRWFAASKGVALEPSPTAIAWTLMILGGLLAITCIWEFAWTGRGTPAPFDPPRRLVLRGPYRWVRNPMYVGMGIFLIAEALMLPMIRREMLILIAVMWALITLFILVYEEPTLRRLFNGDYVDYCRHVRRWLPRLTPFDKNSSAAVPSADLD